MTERDLKVRDEELRAAIHASRPEATVLEDDGVIPNSRLPVVVYRGALNLPDRDSAALIEKILAANAWGGTWRDGIYRYHHYHSTAHEVLCIVEGSVTAQLGGERGLKQKLERGDVVVIPAGVAHKNLGCSEDLLVIGAYPAGQDWDICYAKASERVQAVANIAHVPLPTKDPIFGGNGPLLELWKAATKDGGGLRAG